MKRQHRIRLKFEPRDLWVGVFWDIELTRQVCECGYYCDEHGYSSGHIDSALELPDTLNVFVCLIPCLVIHFQIDW